jgi:heptaprenyl diphosphate synthase
LAAAVETLHTATLVHDDIIDNAQTRRGTPTVNADHGTNLAVYAGDFLLVKAVSFLSKAQVPYDKLTYVTNGISALCMGEVDQYYQKFNIPTFYAYLKRIMRKTGILFGAACALGANCAGLTDSQIRASARFGLYYGAAFQIADDLLDMEATQKEIGKPAQNDLKAGIITLPALLAALKDENIREGLAELFKGDGDILTISKSILKSNGISDAKKIKMKFIQKALRQLESLPASASREMLASMANHL